MGRRRINKNILAVGQLSVLVLLQCFFRPLGMFFSLKTFQDEQSIAIKANKFTVFEILKNIYSVSSLSLHVESTDSMIMCNCA